MTSRDTFQRTMRFEKGARSLKAEFGYWTTSVKRFLREGMPRVQDIPDTLSDKARSAAQRRWIRRESSSPI